MSGRTGRECRQLASAQQALLPIERHPAEVVAILRRARDSLVNQRSYGPGDRWLSDYHQSTHVRVWQCPFHPVPKCEVCASLRGTVPQRSLPIEKILDGARDFLIVSFKCEVASVVQIDFRTRVVAPETLGTGLQEKRIVLAPDSK